MNDGETISDIVAEMRKIRIREFQDYADRIEAAARREMDNIHRAMVILAGIEMESTENPPRLWTALEDAYDALSDALGTDGDTTADEEEAKATGRHFVVVRPSGDCAKLREALELCMKEMCTRCREAAYAQKDFVPCLKSCETLKKAKAALTAPSRNCDEYSHDEALRVWAAEKENEQNGCFDEWLYATATEQEGENDESK